MHRHEEVRSDDGRDAFHICDGYATVQGPNYALAKRIQHWRTVAAHCDDGAVVSSNVAPATFTASVEHNPVTFAISRAVAVFEPLEVFDKETTKALMTLLLVHDLRCPESAAHGGAATGKKRGGGGSVMLRNPLELVSQTAVDCGVWRAGVKIGSTAEVALLLYAVGRPLQRLGLPSPLQARL